MAFRDNRIEHLIAYAGKKQIPTGAIYKYKGQEIPKMHIILPEPTKREAVIKHNLLNGVTSELLPCRLHPDAHHLNSSQIACYNFFRPLLTLAGCATEALCRLLAQFGIRITTAARCCFEYNPPCSQAHEKSEVDFRIFDASTDVEVLMEIKYTESEFGQWDGKYATPYNFYSFYDYPHKLRQARYLDTQKLQIDGKQIPADFIAYYQLFRNTQLLRTDKQYFMAICPADNMSVINKWINFADDYLLPEGREHCILATWEELIDILRERDLPRAVAQPIDDFEDKYLSYYPSDQRPRRSRSDIMCIYGPPFPDDPASE